jgi:hypothetical protein
MIKSVADLSNKMNHLSFKFENVLLQIEQCKSVQMNDNEFHG